ncbi:hypothetical protein K523DRAFT_357968 [Schizophyllum commune Tattone D]|nr:hypothetical protein K523DRAFT_357968 [Schizophyllum commune Tattone D]
MSATSSESPDSEPEPAVDLEEEAHLTEIRKCELDKQIIRDEADKYEREGATDDYNNSKTEAIVKKA